MSNSLLKQDFVSFSLEQRVERQRFSSPPPPHLIANVSGLLLLVFLRISPRSSLGVGAWLGFCKLTWQWQGYHEYEYNLAPLGTSQGIRGVGRWRINRVGGRVAVGMEIVKDFH